MFIGRERELDELNSLLAAKESKTANGGTRRLFEIFATQDLVYEGELAQSVPADRCFDSIVPAEKLLKEARGSVI